jgi:Ariadne domain
LSSDELRAVLATGLACGLRVVFAEAVRFSVCLFEWHPRCLNRLQSLEQLFHARRILGQSYVFAYYMFDNVMFGEEITPEQNAINQNLFEDQQQMMEAEVHCTRRMGLLIWWGSAGWV